MYNAIIVGARCAGAPTAMLLAEKGYRVLLVDKATFPSDTISTHIIWPHGAEIMDRWGLLDRLAATGCPPIARNLIFDVGPFALKGWRRRYQRRSRRLLSAAHGARQAAGGRRRGGRGRAARRIHRRDAALGRRSGGRHPGPQPDWCSAVEERARVVIGADGVHSLVAEAVRAAEYDATPPLATNYYSYFSGFAADDIEEYVRDYQAVRPASRPTTVSRSDRRSGPASDVRGRFARTSRVTS